jgi:hypothetical protein
MNNITNIAKMVAEIVIKEMAEAHTMTKIEQTTKLVLHEIGQKVVEQVLEKKETTYPPATVSCECGEEAKYIRRREGTFHTLFGKVNAKRAYYLCQGCHEGHYPLDERLGLRPNALSAELTRLVAMTGVQLPFRAGRDLFETLTLVSVSDQAMGKATQIVGGVVETEEEKWQRKIEDEQFLLKQKRENKPPLRLYGAIDATKVHVRDGEDHRWRDLKIGSWFEARGKPPTASDGQWRIEAENIHYYTDICPASDFGSLFWSTGVAHHAQLARELVMLGDGAEWIWNLVAEHFPNAIQILDWFHASEHLMPVAQAAFSSDSEQSAWVAQMKQLMWDGHIAVVIEAIDRLALTCSQDILRTTANYFEGHKERMRYAHFRNQGYQIGSGTIESAAKQIGMMRMKVPGAIWNEENARLVAKARAAYLSDHWASLPLAL